MTIRNHPRTAFLVLIVFLLACSGMSAQSAKIVNIKGDSYESEELTKEIAVSGVTHLVLRASGDFSGSITVKSADEGHKLTYFEHFVAGSLEEAEKFSEYISVETTQSGQELFVDASAMYDAPWKGTDLSARLEVELVLPTLIGVEIHAKRFDITVAGPFTVVDINNEYGRIKVSDVTEMLRLDSENSRITLSDLKGDISVSTSNNLIRAREIDTQGKTAVFSNEYGVIEISRFAGAIKCVTSYAAVDLRGIKLRGGDSRISTTYGSIDAEIMEMQGTNLYLSDDQSNIELTLPEDVSAEFDLNVDRGGRIHLSGIPVTPVEMERERLLAHTDDPDSKIKVEINGIGTVNISGKKFYGGP
jgi:hypothetical protein